MKRTLTIALLASAAAFVLGTATPSLAQQDSMRAYGARSQQAYHQSQAGRYWNAQYYGSDARGYGAYAYVPGGPGSLDTCATEGSYGQGLDYSACGAGGGD